MDLGLKDHVILVTGGASGIGQAITRACLAEGARVLVLTRISEGVEEFMQEMQDHYLPCELRVTELDDPEHCRSAVEYLRERYGRLDALVNNAGFNDGVGLENGSIDGFQRSLSLNLLHCYALAHHAVPLLKASRGSILNVASKVAVTGQGGTSGYAASKGALLALTREWAAELIPFSVRVNCIIPAEVMTPQYTKWLRTLADPDDTVAHIAAQVPLEHRMTRVEEIASTAVFLLSPTQSSHTTGQHIHIDGGYVHLDRMLTVKALH